MHRCSFFHQDFACDSHEKRMYRGDGTEQCWMSDVGNFGTKDRPNYLCILHAPLGATPIDRDDWEPNNRGEMQSSLLKTYINSWNEANNELKSFSPTKELLIFSFPGLHCGKIDFENYCFSGPVVFSDAVFREDANFRCTKFLGSVNFCKANFEDLVNFSDSIFSNYTNFSDAKFCSIAVFQNVMFQDDVHFSGSEFNGYLFIANSSFSEWADFRDSKFSMVADFHGTTFSGNAAFYKAEFEDVAEFTNTSFLELAHFTDAQFSAGAIFSNATFKGDTGFSGVTFESTAMFGGVLFGAEFSDIISDDERGDTEDQHVTDFSNSVFFGSTLFLDSIFIRAPLFHNARLHQNTDFRGAIFQDKESREAPPAYRTLKIAMGEVRSRHDEADFYAYELESILNQSDTSFSDKFFIHLYCAISDYGRSTFRSLGWLLGLNGILTFLYYLMLIEFNEKIFHWQYTYRFSIQQIVKPFSIWTKKGLPDVCMVGCSKLVWFEFFATVQSIASIAFIALFLLAVRRKFRLN